MIKALIFGMTLAIAVGPIAILIVNFGLKEGRAKAMLSGTGAALADFTFALISLSIGAYILPILINNQTIFQFIASAVLVLFGLRMVIAAFQSLKTSSLDQKSKKTNPLILTYLLTIVNPLTIVAFAGFSGQLIVNNWGDLFLHSTAIFLGSLCVQYVFALTSSWLRTWLTNPHTVRILNALSGIGIMSFGLIGLI